MYTALQAGAIGIRDMALAEQIELAAVHGFEGLSFSIEEADKIGVEKVKDLFDKKKIKPSNWGLPLKLKSDDNDFKSGLTRLEGLAAVAKELDCYRATSVVMPFSDDMPFKDNFEWHLNRLRSIAQILGDQGCSLGLEFIGPKTVRQGHKYEFIYSMDGTLELGAEIGNGNVGLLLDAWHLYTSHGSTDEISRLSDKDVVVVHVNDAPAGIAIDEQLDLKRCMPGETGVMDLVGFMKGLVDIRYSGPVIVEPFSERVNDMTAADAARATSDSLREMWEKAGI